jgi:glycine/D-amino acid oxidase-like deaminating enzyme
MDYDAIVIGGGPAGLSAGTELAQGKYRVLLLEKESFGGPIINVEWINGYPHPGEKLAGAVLASELMKQAEQSGVEMELAEVVEIEPYSGCISVVGADGKAYTSSVVICAGGLHSRKLDVPGEDTFQGKGMIHCAMCDAGLYRDQVVAVCGGGDAGLIEALYLARFASKVFVVEAGAQLAAKPVLQARALADAKLRRQRRDRPRGRERRDRQAGDSGGVRRAGSRRLCARDRLSRRRCRARCFGSHRGKRAVRDRRSRHIRRRRHQERIAAPGCGGRGRGKGGREERAAISRILATLDPAPQQYDRRHRRPHRPWQDLVGENPDRGGH